jgi:hypothetical protein
MKDLVVMLLVLRFGRDESGISDGSSLEILSSLFEEFNSWSIKS